MRFGGRQQKDDICRRLLQSFEQSVECRLGQHVDFVDDIYFIRCAQRFEIYMAFQVTYLIYASVGRSVYLDDIKVFALGYCSAGFTFTARLTVRRAILAVQSLCDQAGSRCLHPWVPK